MSTHENINKFGKVKISSNKNFCLTFSCVLFFLAFYPLLHHEGVRVWALSLSIAFLMLAFTKPQLIQPLNYLWARIGLILGKFMVPIVMGALYFSIFFLTGLVIKWIRKDILNLKFDASKRTYWFEHEGRCFPKENFKNQF